jgi:hypothetical protein
VQCCISRALNCGEYEDLVAAYGSRQDIAEFDNGAVIPNAKTSETNPSIVIKVFDD